MKKKLTVMLMLFVTYFSRITCAGDATLIMPDVEYDESKPVGSYIRFHEVTNERIYLNKELLNFIKLDEAKTKHLTSAHNLYSCLKAWEFINRARNEILCQGMGAKNEQQQQCTTAKSLTQGLKKDSEIILKAGKNLFTLNNNSIQRTIDVGSPHQISKEEMKDIYEGYGKLTVELGNFLDPEVRNSLSDSFCRHLNQNEKELHQIELGLKKCQSIKEITNDESNLKNIERAKNKIKTCQDNLHSGPRNSNPSPIPQRDSPK